MFGTDKIELFQVIQVCVIAMMETEYVNNLRKKPASRTVGSTLLKDLKISGLYQ